MIVDLEVRAYCQGETWKTRTVLQFEIQNCNTPLSAWSEHMYSTYKSLVKLVLNFWFSPDVLFYIFNILNLIWNPLFFFFSFLCRALNLATLMSFAQYFTVLLYVTGSTVPLCHTFHFRLSHTVYIISDYWYARYAHCSMFWEWFYCNLECCFK